MAPPGRPNMTSVPSISRLLMRAWAPVSFMVTSSIGPPEANMKNRSQPRFGVGDERGRDALATVRRGYCKSVHRRAPTVPRGDDGADKRAIVEGDEQRVGRVGKEPLERCHVIGGRRNRRRLFPE